MSTTVTVIAHSLQPQRAFHSTLSTTFVLDQPDSSCAFFALYAFPQSIIIDRHELADRRLSFEFWGESNLELPVFALDQTASSLLLINATPAEFHSRHVTVDIPVHARYGAPGVAQPITISSPTSFWACVSDVSTALSSELPVAKSTMLSPFSLFSDPSVSSHLASLQVPVASKRDLFAVELGTAAVVLAAFLWLVHRCWRAANALQSRHVKEQ